MKIEHALPDKPEVMEMADILQIDADAVVGKLIRVWSWFDNHTENGNAPVTVRALLNRHAGVAGFVTAMLRVGWMSESNDRLVIGNFDRHNGKSAKVRALGRNRGQSCRAKRNASSVTDALPEKRREENIVSITQSERSHEVPTVDLVKQYARSAAVPISEACAVAFHDTQEAGGWITKHGHSIADWRAALRRYASLWNENEKSKNGPRTEHRQAKAESEYPEQKQTKLPRL